MSTGVEERKAKFRNVMQQTADAAALPIDEYLRDVDGMIARSARRATASPARSATARHRGAESAPRRG